MVKKSGKCEICGRWCKFIGSQKRLNNEEPMWECSKHGEQNLVALYPE